MSDKKALNEFKVPRNVWSKWTLVGKHVFNKTFRMMMDSPWAFRHPQDRVAILDPHWRVVAWNAAFVAAGIASRGEKALLKELVKEIEDKNG